MSKFVVKKFCSKRMYVGCYIASYFYVRIKSYKAASLYDRWIQNNYYSVLLPRVTSATWVLILFTSLSINFECSKRFILIFYIQIKKLHTTYIFYLSTTTFNRIALYFYIRKYSNKMKLTLCNIRVQFILH